MSALRYYDLPFDPPEASRRTGWIDRICRSAWAWAIRRQEASAAEASEYRDADGRKEAGTSGSLKSS
ncbi:MAG: hypothetical protein ACKVPY_03615 [Paracoccaceae bacterium]